MKNPASFLKNPVDLTNKALRLILPAVLVTLVIYSCTKPANSTLLPLPSNGSGNVLPSRSSGNSGNGNSSVSGLPADVSMALYNLNLAFNDVNFVIGLSAPGKSVTANQYVICGATIDSSNFHTKGVLVLNYNGTTECGPDRVLRSGQISISTPLTNNWDSAGSGSNLTFVNYKVANSQNNRSITLNGTQILTNTSGGLVSSYTGLPVVFKIQGLAMSVTFNDSIVRTWNLEITRTVIATGSATVHTITVSEQGDTTLNGVANTGFWGTTKSGNTFSTSINGYALNSNCGFRYPTGGSEVFALDSNSVAVTYGVDPAGNPVNSGCAFGYKEVWKNAAGVPQTVIFRY